MYGLYEDDYTPAPVVLKRYRVRFWDSVHWGWYDENALAENEQQCRELADKECAAHLRVKHATVGDSLQIIFVENVALPLVLR
jgi:hypothetical protein